MPPDQNVVRELVLEGLRCACFRAKMAAMEVGFIGSALKDGTISPADALLTLEASGWDGLIDPLILNKIRAALAVRHSNARQKIGDKIIEQVLEPRGIGREEARTFAVECDANG
jgi:hypothetical protein